MSIPNLVLNTNTVMAIVLSLVLLYGLILGQSKLKTFALSAFVGLVMVLTFADGAFTLLHKFHFDLGGHLSLTVVKLALFVIPVLILEFGHRDKSKNHGGTTVTLILAVLTAALLISSVLTFLDSQQSSRIINESIIAHWIYALRLVWLVAVPIAVVGENFIPAKHS